MALWARVQQLNGDAMRQIQLVYGVHFPIEVRHFFANWIEDQHWYVFFSNFQCLLVSVRMGKKKNRNALSPNAEGVRRGAVGTEKFHCS